VVLLKRRCLGVEEAFFKILSYIGLFLLFLLIAKKVIPDIIIGVGDFICVVKKTWEKVINKIRNS